MTVAGRVFRVPGKARSDIIEVRGRSARYLVTHMMLLANHIMPSVLVRAHRTGRLGPSFYLMEP